MLIERVDGKRFLRPNPDLFRQILQNIFKLLLATRGDIEQNDPQLRINGSKRGDAVIAFEDKLYESDFSAVHPVILLF